METGGWAGGGGEETDGLHDGVGELGVEAQAFAGGMVRCNIRPPLATVEATAWAHAGFTPQ
jgi:hypothetical protein